jgi:nucleoside-diphosphate kinase
MKEYCFIALKPDALERQLVDVIIKQFVNSGFHIETFGYKIIDELLIFNHYKQLLNTYGDVFKDKVRRGFVGKPMIPVILSYENENAISVARKIIGATDPAKAEAGTIRGDLGIDSLEKAVCENRICYNLIHGSDSHSSYLEEVNLWFDKQIARKYALISR